MVELARFLTHVVSQAEAFLSLHWLILQPHKEVIKTGGKLAITICCSKEIFQLLLAFARRDVKMLKGEDLDPTGHDKLIEKFANDLDGTELRN